jgi:hypothetical protein
MKKSSLPPVVPYPAEEDVATVPGPRAGTAIRVQLAGGCESVRLEQLAYSQALGWYVQKSFCIPGSMLADLIPQLRKADCLIPRQPKQKLSKLSPEALLPFPGPRSTSKSA